MRPLHYFFTFLFPRPFIDFFQLYLFFVCMFSANYKLRHFGRSINEKAKQLNVLNQYLKAVMVFLVRLLKD